jgi:hypothetical protein
MNVERLQQLSTYLAGLKDRNFDLSSWFFNPKIPLTNLACNYHHHHMPVQPITNAGALEGSCKSTACIAGHALALFAPNDLVPENPTTTAGYLLDLTLAQADALFTPEENADPEYENEDGPNYIEGIRRSIARAQAIQVLDHFITTGEVDWRIIRS